VKKHAFRGARIGDGRRQDVWSIPLVAVREINESLEPGALRRLLFSAPDTPPTAPASHEDRRR
jgi:hypothetical protein